MLRDDSVFVGNESRVRDVLVPRAEFLTPCFRRLGRHRTFRVYVVPPDHGVRLDYRCPWGTSREYLLFNVYRAGGFWPITNSNALFWVGPACHWMGDPAECVVVRGQAYDGSGMRPTVYLRADGVREFAARVGGLDCDLDDDAPPQAVYDWCDDRDRLAGLTMYRLLCGF